MDTMNAKQDAYQAARLVSPNGVTRITQFETVVEPKHSDSQITSEGQTIPGQPLQGGSAKMSRKLPKMTYRNLICLP